MRIPLAAITLLYMTAMVPVQANMIYRDENSPQFSIEQFIQPARTAAYREAAPNEPQQNTQRRGREYERNNLINLIMHHDCLSPIYRDAFVHEL